MGVLFATATSPALIVLFGFLVTVTSNVFCNTYHICQAEIFPTSVKETAGTALTRSHGFIGALPFILLILHSSGAAAMFLTVGGAVIIAAAAIAALGPRTNGRVLGDITRLHFGCGSDRGLDWSENLASSRSDPVLQLLHKKFAALSVALSDQKRRRSGNRFAVHTR